MKKSRTRDKNIIVQVFQNIHFVLTVDFHIKADVNVSEVDLHSFLASLLSNLVSLGTMRQCVKGLGKTCFGP